MSSEMLTSGWAHGVSHALYPTATATLCGIAVDRLVAVGDIRPAAPSCDVCGTTARAFDQVDGSTPAHWNYRRRRLRAVA